MTVSRLVKLLKSYTDAQEEDSQNLKNSIKNINSRVDDIADKICSGDQRVHGAKGNRSMSPLKKDNFFK